MRKPIVFIETNFLISLVFPHLDFRAHQEAKQLLTGNLQNYQIVIPFYSTFESIGTARRIKLEFKKWLGQLGTYYKNLQRSENINHGLTDHVRLLNYIEFDFESELNHLLDQVEVIHIDEQVMEIARNEVIKYNIFSGKDAMDAYILASILRRCREVEDSLPKIFMSTNVNDFGDIPEDVLNSHKLVYIKNFNYEYGLKQWNEKFI